MNMLYLSPSFDAGVNFTCEDYRLDPLGLRTHPECDFVRGPSYGRVVFEYSENHVSSQRLGGKYQPSDVFIDSVKLQILGGHSPEDVRLETVIDTATCPPISSP